MKSFGQWLSEGSNVEAGYIDAPSLTEGDLSALNVNLDEEMEGTFLSPYIALEKIRGVMEEKGIVLPDVSFKEFEGGEQVFEIATADGCDSYLDDVLYFSWCLSESTGLFEVYAEVLPTSELERLLNKAQ